LLGRLLLLVVLIAAVLWFLHWFRRTPPERVARLLRKGALWGVIGFLVLMAVTGRLNPIFAALAAAVPVVMRLVNLVQVLPMIQRVLRSLGIATRSIGTGPASAASGGNGNSSIRTRFLAMTLEHASGRMDGEVLEGPYQGRMLSTLDLTALMDLLQRCRSEDPQSAALLEAYLDRTQGEDWREASPGSEGPGPAADAPMNREEALAVLGLGQGAGEEAIREAHRRLIQKLHPDRGGSDYLAAKINAAKRLLLGD
jgi:hypothetical protein